MKYSFSMSKNQYHIKRKKYLEPDASEQEKIVPRTSVWRCRKYTLVANQNKVPAYSQVPVSQKRQEEVEDAFETRELEDLSNSDQQADFDNEFCLHHEESNIDFLSSDHDQVSGDDFSSLSDEDMCTDHTSHKDDEKRHPDNVFKSDSLADNLKRFDSPLFENAQTTIAETLLMVMVYGMKHKLTWTAIEDLLKLFNTIFGQCVLPQTKYVFNKIFGTTDSMTFHFYCSDCNHYLGKYEGQLTKKFDKTNSNLICPNPKCKKIHDANNLKEGSFFATLSIKNQIAALLDRECVRQSLSTSLKKINENLYDISESFSDLTDGLLYKEKRRELFKDHDISLIMNTDGSPVFKSSHASMWLIQVLINELPPQLRWSHGIIGGLWFGKGHPNMKLFMEIFVNELSELSIDGIKWKDNDKIVESRVYTLCGCFDSPARCAVQNMNQFNGYFGCPWCLHPGVLVDGVVKYVTLEEDPELRTERETLKLMGKVLNATEKFNIKGIKGSSPMILAKGLDFIRGITPDYMHAVLLGVTRQIAEIYLTSVGEQYYIGSPTDLKRIDKRLLKIKPPHLFTRLPRSITERKFWKAHEWKKWLLYYAAPCLLGILPDRFIRHLSLLSNSMFLLLQDTLSPDDISSAERMLTEFVIKTEILFGPAAMTFNMHQMLHMTSSVRDLGPLWAHSAFVFEDGNGKMLNLVTAAKGVPLQILNRFSMEKKLEHLFSQGFTSEKVAVFYECLHSNSTLKNIRTIGPGIHMLGKEKVSKTFNKTEVQAYVAAIGAVPQVASEYSRMIMNSSMYHSEAYTRAGKTDNTVVKVTTECGISEIVKIQKFIVIPLNNSFQGFIFCRELLVPVKDEPSNCMPKHVKERCLVPTEHSVLIPIEKIKCICAFIEIDAIHYVCEIPNFYEKD